MAPRSIPAGLDQHGTERVERSFLVVRIVRGSLLLLFWAVALVGVEVHHWSTVAAAAVVFAAAVQAVVLAGSCRRLLRARGHESGRAAR